MSLAVSFDDFRQEWLASIREGTPSTTVLGHRFAHKLVSQWLDLGEDSDSIVYCDGSGDGGIDIAYLQRGEAMEEVGAIEGSAPADGDTWYLVQSKYGSAFQGTSTLYEEAVKVLDTLEGKPKRLSSLAEGLQQRLQNFRAQASDRDRIKLVFATDSAMTDEQRHTLAVIRSLGRERIGPIFDAEAVSIETIYQRILEGEAPQYISIDLEADLTPSGQDLLVGPIPLLSLYRFLKSYRDQTQDLDRLYEKNVRRFLGNRGRINKAMQNTLRQTPERFGLYNNGITIVVADFQSKGDQALVLHDPYVVNGCQTTRTIWDVFYQQLESGGTGISEELASWQDRVKRGVVIGKIVKVGSGGETIQDITRYTNSQNAVREKDFLALSRDFKGWAEQMGARYGIFLEIQRGGWESRSAFQKQHPNARPQFSKHANAFDLLKVYAAGWRGEAGLAFGKNSPFLPNGPVFESIMREEGDNAFGVEDLYAAYWLHDEADSYKFGRGAPQTSRRQTRFLFYMIAMELLKNVLSHMYASTAPSGRDLTNALLNLAQPEHREASAALLDTAVDAVDEYLNRQMSDSAFTEPAFQSRFNNDLNGFLKWEALGKENSTPRLRTLIAGYQRSLNFKASGEHISRREFVMRAISPSSTTRG